MAKSKFDYRWLFQRTAELYRVVPYHYFNGYALPPFHTIIFISSNCNLECSVCLSMRKQKDREMSFEEVKEVIRKIPRFSLVSFSGGEPFFRRDILDILRFTSRLNKCDVFTNGTFLNEAAVKELVMMGPRSMLHNGLVGVDISIRGLEEVHDSITRLKGSFKKTIEGIRILQEEKKRQGKKYPLLITRTLIIPQNVHLLSRIFALGEELGAYMCNFILYDRIGFSSDSLRTDPFAEVEDNLRPHEMIAPEVLEEQFGLIQQMSRKSKVRFSFTPPWMPPPEVVKYYNNGISLADYRCFFPWFRLLVLPNGDIRVCSGKLAGNLLQEKLGRLWNNDVFRQFRKELKNRGMFSTCVGCMGMEFRKNPLKTDDDIGNNHGL